MHCASEYENQLVDKDTNHEHFMNKENKTNDKNLSPAYHTHTHTHAPTHF